MRRLILSAGRLAAAAAILFCAGHGATAAENPDGEVAVGGEHVLTVRFPANGMSVKERADAIQERLVTILSDPKLKPSDIVALPSGRTEAKIVVKDRLLVTIDAQTARFNTSKPLALAKAWADHLRRVLPRINVKPNPNNGAPANGTN